MKDFKKLTYSDRFIFGKVNSIDLELCRETIELVSGISTGEGNFITVEKDIQITYRGKKTRLDLMLDTSEHRIDFDMENRKHNRSRMLPLRLRFYQDVIDLDMLTDGMKYTMLKRNVVIFLCTYDPFGKGYYRYIFKNKCAHDDKLELGDETVKIVLNAGGRRPAPGDDVSEGLRNFLEYVKNGKVSDDFTRRLEMKVEDVVNCNDFKVEYMSAVAEYMADEYEKDEMRKENDVLQAKNDALQAKNDALLEELNAMKKRLEEYEMPENEKK